MDKQCGSTGRLSGVVGCFDGVLASVCFSEITQSQRVHTISCRRYLHFITLLQVLSLSTPTDMRRRFHTVTSTSLHSLALTLVLAMRPVNGQSLKTYVALKSHSSNFIHRCTLSPVNTKMGVRSQVRVAFAQSWYFINHPGQLSLSIPSWVGAMSTSDGHGHCQGRNDEF